MKSALIFRANIDRAKCLKGIRSDVTRRNFELTFLKTQILLIFVCLQLRDSVCYSIIGCSSGLSGLKPDAQLPFCNFFVICEHATDTAQFDQKLDDLSKVKQLTWLQSLKISYQENSNLGRFMEVLSHKHRSANKITSTRFLLYYVVSGK